MTFVDCLRIYWSGGSCGTSWKQNKTYWMFAAGCLGSSGYPDHPHHPQQRDHPQPPDLLVQARREQVVPPPQQRPGERPRLVHVSDQHRPHGPQVAGVTLNIITDNKQIFTSSGAGMCKWLCLLPFLRPDRAMTWLSGERVILFKTFLLLTSKSFVF